MRSFALLLNVVVVLFFMCFCLAGFNRIPEASEIPYELVLSYLGPMKIYKIETTQMLTFLEFLGTIIDSQILRFCPLSSEQR